MKQTDITHLRLLSQQIETTGFTKIEDLVGWMGAMQAQDYAMAKWAVGVRMPGITEQQVDAALHHGAIIRTHVLRPTWHFVRPEDIRWMLELSAPQIKTSMRSRDRELGLTDDVYKKTNRAIEKMLKGGLHWTREEIIAALEKAKLVADTSQAWHVIVRAELEGILCSGRPTAKKQTYTLLDGWIPDTAKLPKEEALGKLAKTYFNSHGPATSKDFAWWSGLPAADVRTAISLVANEFIQETIGTDSYLWNEPAVKNNPPKNSVYLLPAFDEYLISYKDRTAAIQLSHQAKAFTSNGIFRPVIVVNGTVTGTWRRTIKKDNVLVEPNFLVPATKATKQLLEKAAEAYGQFSGKKATIIYPAS
jgi:hypothetical protein